MADALYQFILNLKYPAIFLGAFIEGPTVALIVGVLVKLKVINLGIGFLLHVIGDFSADFMYYGIGLVGGRKFLHKIASFFRFSLEEMEQIKFKVTKHSWKLILIGKITHFLGLPVLIGVGLAHYSWYKFGVINLLATLIKSAILIIIGYFWGHLWRNVDSTLSYLTMIALFIILIQILYFIIRIITLVTLIKEL